uniref:Uncharacterized protein n=1 Tax=Oreochromis niloticus TaxID=8128 RepID=A0A669DKP1_ORENI
MERNYKVIVHGPRGEKVEVNLCRTEEQFKNMTVRQLKEKIWEKFPVFAGKNTGNRNTSNASTAKKDSSRLEKLIRKAGSVVGMKLDTLVTVAEKRALKKLLDILDTPP